MDSAPQHQPSEFPNINWSSFEDHAGVKALQVEATFDRPPYFNQGPDQDFAMSYSVYFTWPDANVDEVGKTLTEVLSTHLTHCHKFLHLELYNSQNDVFECAAHQVREVAARSSGAESSRRISGFLHREDGQSTPRRRFYESNRYKNFFVVVDSPEACHGPGMLFVWSQATETPRIVQRPTGFVVEQWADDSALLVKSAVSAPLAAARLMGSLGPF
jgi:hypothetical protein